MQATYIMVANKEALPYLPAGADINALTSHAEATSAAVVNALRLRYIPRLLPLQLA
jgi:multiple sugar transport system substrate-binding protein